MKYEAVIGLEVHAQLLTSSKLFCGCSTKFGSEPNTQVDPVCLGLPGVLPVLNRKAVEYAVKMALATDCTVNNRSIFARKNYFYPDLPKGYQISQYTEPLAEHGWLDIDLESGRKRIGITRIHMEEDAGKLGTKAEIKNITSFKFVKEAIDYEIQRQIDLVESGGKVVQETRLFDSSKGITASMRSKEEAHDYRYFPDPDLLPLLVEDSLVEGIRPTLPELPQAKRERFTTQYGIPAYDAGVLTSSRDLADYYESAVKETGEPKVSSNWVMGEVLRLLKEDNRDIKDCPVSPKGVAEIIKLVKGGQISGKIAKEVFEEMYRTGKPAAGIVQAKGLTQISGEDELARIVDDIIKANPDNVERYRSGKATLFGFFVGEAMKATKGKANPQVINRLLKEKLGG